MDAALSLFYIRCYDFYLRTCELDNLALPHILLKTVDNTDLLNSHNISGAENSTYPLLLA